MQEAGFKRGGKATASLQLYQPLLTQCKLEPLPPPPFSLPHVLFVACTKLAFDILVQPVSNYTVQVFR